MNIFFQIKAFFAARNALTKITEEIKTMNTAKPGWKTSEFWFNVMGQLAVIWSSLHGFIPQPWASVISISGIAVYTVARTITKATADIQAAKAA